MNGLRAILYDSRIDICIVYALSQVSNQGFINIKQASGFRASHPPKMEPEWFYIGPLAIFTVPAVSEAAKTAI